MLSQLTSLPNWAPGPHELIVISLLGVMSMICTLGVVFFTYLALRKQSRHEND